MTDLRALARDQPCQIRVGGICNGNPASTVLCHVRMYGISGMGHKSNDVLACWGCAACHAYCDSNQPNSRLWLLEGMARTQAELLRLNIIRVKGERERKPKPIPKILPRRNVA